MVTPTNIDATTRWVLQYDGTTILPARAASVVLQLKTFFPFDQRPPREGDCPSGSITFSLSPEYDEKAFAGLTRLDDFARTTPFVVQNDAMYTPFVKRTEKNGKMYYNVKVIVPRFSDLPRWEKGMRLSVVGRPRLTNAYSRDAKKRIPTLEFVVESLNAAYAAPKDYAFVEP